MTDMIVRVQFVGSVKVALPKYQTTGSAGFDLQAAIDRPIKLSPRGLGSQNWELIPTGLSMEIPAGFEAQIRPRSGLALKSGISIVNSPGTIDSDYRGPIGVILINHGVEAFTINPLDRIAQMIISPVVQVQLELVDVLGDTERGAGGFGSTGTGFIKHGA
ncbi:dUTP diphosphatase [Candidatus Pacearchaeota archaeon]|jgi:dUTP pyrophosphatase|nr:dUTP diphosphatase [Candidatus Pacearchaeota archaeon]